MKKIHAWLELIRFPDLFTIPGDVIAGLLFAAGLPAGAGIPLLALSASAVAAAISGTIFRAIMNVREDMLRHPERPLPSGAVSGRAAMVAMVCAGLLAPAFAVIAGPVALLLSLLLLAAVFSLRSLPFAHLFRVGLGVALAYQITDINLRNLLPAALFAIGLFLFAWGRNRVLATDPAKLMKPGRRIFIVGAIIAYGTLFGIAINLPTDHWYALTCGAVSALSSGVFMVMTYWSFRMFQYPNTANDVRKFCGVMLFALIFLHAGAASLFQSLTITLILLAGAVIARLSAIWISRK